MVAADPPTGIQKEIISIFSYNSLWFCMECDVCQNAFGIFVFIATEIETLKTFQCSKILISALNVFLNRRIMYIEDYLRSEENILRE